MAHRVQFVVTLLTGVLLLVSPRAITSSFGLTMTPDVDLLCSFYGAGELALAFLSFLALRFENGPTLRSLCTYFFVYHAGQAIAGLYAVVGRAPGKVVGNSLVHVVIVPAPSVI